MKKLALTSVFALTSLLACKDETKKDLANTENVPGINLEFMDTSVKPSEDFFKYVNGKWLATTEIPDDQTRWGSFNELRKKTDEDALSILKAVMAIDKDLKKIEVIPGSDQEKAVQLFQTIMDTISRNEQGIEPIKPYLA
ncbi:MAG: M13 family peptidase, partial [Flavobacteriales bacterium]|nr:M13 family peptidase [Flavobacteriales bacterium]